MKERPWAAGSLEEMGAPDRPIAVLLAAGGGSRFVGDQHKLLARLPATTTRPAERVIDRSLAGVLDAAAAGSFDTVVVVTGAVDLADALADATVSPGVSVQTVRHEGWALGQATSLRAGVAAVDRLGADIAVVGLADQPDVAAETWIAVAAAATSPDARAIVVATYDGRPRNPVALHRSVWAELPSEGDQGARALVRASADRVTPVPSAGSPADIDTVEDLERWQNS